MKFSIGNLFTLDIHNEGLKTIGIFLGITLILLVFLGFHGLTVFSFCLSLFIVSFFRNPPRIAPVIQNAIISPADGLITTVEDSLLPEEVRGKDKEKYTRVSVFMSPFNVHVNRIPVAGKIEQVEYIKGKFVNVTLDKDSKDNERNIIVMKSDNNDKVVFTQIAGFLARRIVCYAKPDDYFSTGQEMGIIKFGSRVDVYFPHTYTISVQRGQTAIGGETILGILKK